MQGHVLLRGLKGFRSEEGGLWVRFKKKRFVDKILQEKMDAKKGVCGYYSRKKVCG